MLISAGRLGITASNSNFSPCVFPFQQTHILPLLRNDFAITICFPAGFFHSWSLLGFTPLSVCTPRRAKLGTVCATPDKRHVKGRRKSIFSLKNCC